MVINIKTHKPGLGVENKRQDSRMLSPNRGAYTAPLPKGGLWWKRDGKSVRARGGGRLQRNILTGTAGKKHISTTVVQTTHTACASPSQITSQNGEGSWVHNPIPSCGAISNW